MQLTRNATPDDWGNKLVTIFAGHQLLLPIPAVVTTHFKKSRPVSKN